MARMSREIPLLRGRRSQTPIQFSFNLIEKVYAGLHGATRGATAPTQSH